METLYQIEELMPLVIRLTERFTAKESSSVSYERANQLMEACVYTINEAFDSTISNQWKKESLILNELPKASDMYQLGKENLLEKVKKAYTLYEGILDNFKDYRCRNYADTVRKGMPEFFLHYDMEFNPQDHLLTLDYPVTQDRVDLCGVDRIYDYLLQIKNEQDYMRKIPEGIIRDILSEVVPEYETMFFDNICYEVKRKVEEKQL